MRNAPPDRVVIDTNVIVSAIIKGYFEKVIALVAKYQVQIFSCDKHLWEIRKTLMRPAVKKYLSDSPEAFIDVFLLVATIVEIDERFDRSPDPDDNYLFDLAYTIKAHYIVTGERALLNMKHVNKIKLTTLPEFLQLLEKVKK